MLSFLRNFLEPFSYLIYTVACLMAYIETKSLNKKVLLIFNSIATLLLTYACYIALDYDGDNNWLYNIHYFTSAIALGYYFSSVLQKGVGRIISLLLFFTAVVNLLITYTNITGTFFNSYGTSFLFLCVIVSVFIFFYQLLNNVTEKSIFQNFDFWLISGFLLYFLGSFFIVLTYKYFTSKLAAEQRFNLADLWAIHNVLLFIGAFTALTYQIWGAYRRKLH
jgi:hypothetical protein